MTDTNNSYPPLPADDPRRSLALAQPDTDASLIHIGMVGDTYTVVLNGDDTNGSYTLMDMLISPGGGWLEPPSSPASDTGACGAE